MRLKQEESLFDQLLARYEVEDDYAARFEHHVVGDASTELWVPAAELEGATGTSPGAACEASILRTRVPQILPDHG